MPRPNSSRRASQARSGFTLLEILVVIGLIALLSGVLISGAGRLLSEHTKTPDEIFRDVVTAARKYAVETNAPVQLSFDPKEKQFTATGIDGDRTYPAATPGDLLVEFLVQESGGRAIILADEVVQTDTVPYITFYPDGTCSPFRVQIRVDADIAVTAFDPWTCAPVLENEKK